MTKNARCSAQEWFYKKVQHKTRWSRDWWSGKSENNLRHFWDLFWNSSEFKVKKKLQTWGVCLHLLSIWFHLENPDFIRKRIRILIICYFVFTMGNQKKKKCMIWSTHWWTGNSSMLTQQETSPLDYCSARFQGGDEQKQKSYHCVHICSDWWSVSLVCGDGKSSPWSGCVALSLFWIGCLCSFSVAFS